LARFTCECASEACTEALDVTPDAYDGVRERGRFMVMAGHETAGDERIVDRRTDYVIVESVEPARE
jgi:hypothetical protein